MRIQIQSDGCPGAQVLSSGINILSLARVRVISEAHYNPITKLN